MYYTHEVRRVEEFRTDISLVKEKEGELARMLVESLAAPFEPEKYHDAYRDNLQALIEAKVKGQEVVAPPPKEPSKIVDIMEALKQSLAIAKKPAASETELTEQPAKPAAKRKARG